MANILKNINGLLFYSFACDSYGNNNTEEMWLKFTGYLREDEKELLRKIQSSFVTDIAPDDLEMYASIKRQMEVHKLLPKYIEQNCSDEEHSIVFDFVTKSLVDFIESRMTDEEKRNASTFVQSMPKDILKDFIDSNKDKYNELSVYEAYVLYLANDTYYRIVSNERIERQRIEDAVYNQNLVKHLVRDYGIL